MKNTYKPSRSSSIVYHYECNQTPCLVDKKYFVGHIKAETDILDQSVLFVLKSLGLAFFSVRLY